VPGRRSTGGDRGSSGGVREQEFLTTCVPAHHRQPVSNLQAARRIELECPKEGPGAQDARGGVGIGRIELEAALRDEMHVAV
jgi:hypothetical protein